MSLEDAEDENETVDELPPIGSLEKLSVQYFSNHAIEVAAVTHRGAVRSHNEDQYAVVRRSRFSELLACSLDDDDLSGEREDAWLLMVADGLGGQVSGQVASATAIRAVLKFGGELSSWIMRPSDGRPADMEARVSMYCDAINRAMQAKVDSDPSLIGMATTLTTAYVYGSNATVCNLGDSRSYLIRNHELQQITRDHTLAEELRSHGMPTHVTHAYRNVVTRCFDTSGKSANFDLFHLDLRSDDRLLLCSDGLTNMVSDSELMQIIRVAESTEEACRMLAATALRNGGKDNITLILAHLTGADSSPIAESSETLCMDTTLTN